jgi:hypothetical protein
MQDVGGWQPAGGEAVHRLPGEPGALAAAAERLEPVPHYLVAEGPDGFAVAGHGVVGEVPSHHACQPAPLCRDGLVPTLPALVFDLGQLGPHPLRDGLTRQPEVSGLGLPADVREAQEVERLGLADASRCAVAGGVAPELDQPRLVGMEFEAELREPVAKLGKEPLRIGLMLEPGNKSSAKRTMITSPWA